MTQKFKLALITGASSGIGAALAAKLAGEGIALLLTGRNAERLEALAEKLRTQVSVQTLLADLALPEDRERLCREIKTQGPDLVVNNAGFGLYGNILRHSVQAHSELIPVNIEALTELTIEAARSMVAGKVKGTICNVSSAAAFQSFPSAAVYAATKAYVNSFSEAVDAELEPHGIRVLASCPGAVTTQFSPRAAGKGQVDADPYSHSMPVAFAADEIWRQIQTGKGIHIFNWRYRLGVFLGRYFLPKRTVQRALSSRIEERVVENKL